MHAVVLGINNHIYLQKWQWNTLTKCMCVWCKLNQTKQKKKCSVQGRASDRCERGRMGMVDPKYNLDGLARFTQLHKYNLRPPRPEGRHKTQAAAQGKTQTKAMPEAVTLFSPSKTQGHPQGPLPSVPCLSTLELSSQIKRKTERNKERQE